MRRLITILLLVSLLVPTGAAIASDISAANYAGIIRVTNNSTATGNVSGVVAINATSLIAAGIVNANVTDVTVRNSAGSDTPFMPGYNGAVWPVWAGTSVPAGNQDFTIYNNSSGGEIRYFPGSVGANVSDDAALEIGNNATIAVSGRFDATTSGNITRKFGSYTLDGDGSGNLTFHLLTATTAGPVDEVTDNSSIGISLSTGGSHFSIVSDANDGTYVYTTSGTFERDMYDITPSTTGSPYPITNIQVRVRGQASGGTIDGEARGVLLFNGTTYNGTTNAYDGVLTTKSSQWTTNPATSAAWTWADIALITEIGVDVRQTGGAQMRAMEVDLQIVYEKDDSTTSITASGLTSGEKVIQASIGGDRPDFDDWATDAQVLVQFGAGLIPAILLEEQEITGAVASITFDDITAQVAKYEAITGTTARHLVVLVNAASNLGASQEVVRLRINGDGGANYNEQLLSGQGAVAAASTNNNATSATPFLISGTSTANAMDGGLILFPHAFNTANDKTAIAYGGASEDEVQVNIFRRNNTGAITSLALFPNASAFVSGSVFQLAVVDERYLVEEATPASGNVTFSGIAGTGNDLTVIGYARSSRAVGADNININFNGDTTTGNYPRQDLTGVSAVTAASSSSDAKIGRISDAGATANVFGPVVGFVNQYAEGTNDPAYLFISGYNAAAQEVHIVSGRRNNVAAVTSLSIKALLGSGFENGTIFSLYRVPRTAIARVELVGTANVTFSNIPQTYEAVQLLCYCRSDDSDTEDDLLLSINGNTTAATYDTQTLSGSGAAVAAARNAASRILMKVPAANEGANEFGGGIATFPQYAQTDRHKHAFGMDGVTENYVFLRSNRIELTAGISSIGLSTDNGTGLVSGSIIELVGLMPSRTMSITVDGTVEAIGPTANYTAADTTNGITFFNGGIMPYVQAVNVTINGTVAGNWPWQYSNTFTDTSVNGNDMTPSFRTATSDSDVTMELISFTPLSQSKVDTDVAVTWPAFGVGNAPSAPSTAYTENATPGIFFASFIHNLWSGTGMGSYLPVATFWYMFAFFIIIGISIIVYWGFAEKGQQALLIKIVISAAIMTLFALPGPNIYGLYVVIYYVMFSFGVLILSKSYGW